MADVCADEVIDFLRNCGKGEVYNFIMLCAEIANIWCTDDEEDLRIEQEIGENVDPIRFLRTAWVISEMADEYEPIFRRIRKKFPLLHVRLQDQADRAERKQLAHQSP